MSAIGSIRPRGPDVGTSCPGGANARVYAIVRSDLLMRGLAFLADSATPIAAHVRNRLHPAAGAGCRDSCPEDANVEASAIARPSATTELPAVLATPQRPSRQRVEAGTGHPWPAPARPSRRMSAKGSIRPRGPDVGTSCPGGRQCPRFRHCQKLRTDATAGRPGRLHNADCDACPGRAPSGRGGRISGLLSWGAAADCGVRC